MRIGGHLEVELRNGELVKREEWAELCDLLLLTDPIWSVIGNVTLAVITKPVPTRLVKALSFIWRLEDQGPAR